MPAISQWPVVVSFPGDNSAIFRNSPMACQPAQVLKSCYIPQPELFKVGSRNPDMPVYVTQGIASIIPHLPASGSSPIPRLSIRLLCIFSIAATLPFIMRFLQAPKSLILSKLKYTTSAKALSLVYHISGTRMSFLYTSLILFLAICA